MTTEIALVFFILSVSVVLLITEWIPMEVTALLVLGSVALTGLVSPAEALAGYTAWAARSGRWEEEMGRLEIGHRADLVALELPAEGAPEAAWKNLPLRLTMVDGEIVYEDLP